jgi:HSP20 family molecular chaperone IbpA
MSGFKTMAMPDVFDLMWRDFDSFFNGLYEGRVNTNHSSISSNDIYREVSYPPMNLWVEKDSKDLILEFAVAGIPMNNININVEGDYLELEIDKILNMEVNDSYKLVRKGIKTGRAKQRIYIPSSKYKTDEVKAELKDGILLVKVPSREEVRPKKIQIEYSNGVERLK